VAIFFIFNRLGALFTHRAASEEIQVMYDHNTVHRQDKKGGYRAPSSKGGKFRADQRLVREGDQVEGSMSFIYKIIGENYEKLAIIEVEKGATKEAKLEAVPLNASWMLYVGGQFAVAPGHVMYGNDRSRDKEYHVRLYKSGIAQIFPADSIIKVKDLAGDLVLLKFPDITPKRNITQHFETGVPSMGRLEHVLPLDGYAGVHVRSATSWQNMEYTLPFANDSYGDVVADLVMEGIPNERGMCGTVYCCEKTQKIVGMHVGGNPVYKRGYANTLFQDDMLKEVMGFDITRPLDLTDQLQSLQEGVDVIGRVAPEKAAYVATQTKLQRARFDMESFPVADPGYAPAQLKPTAEGSPAKKAYKRISNQSNFGRPQGFDEVMLEGIAPKGFDCKSASMPCTLEEAVYGIPGYMKGIDMNASVGYFFKKLGFTSRRKLFFNDKGEQEIHPLVRRAVEQSVEKFQAGVITPVVFEDSLKDELRSEAKRADCNTRLYCAGDLVSLLIQKMFLGRFFVEFCKNPCSSPVGLSLNPHSCQWGELYGYLKGAKRDMRRILAGDFTDYDISVKWYLVEKFVEFHKRMCPDAPWFVSLIIYANFLGWHLFMHLVHLRGWGTASGSFITSMFNTFVNWFIHKHAFVTLFSEREWEVVRSTFTGDDSLVTVPDEYKEYDMEYLGAFFAQMYQMVYTSCFKDDTVITWSNATYLKRTFVRGQIGMMAPISTKTLYNMCAWSDGEPSEQQEESIIGSLLLEAQHHGAPFYGQIENWVRKEKARLGADWLVPTFRESTAMRKSEY
jgi:hypothetical protein